MTRSATTFSSAFVALLLAVPLSAAAQDMAAAGIDADSGPLTAVQALFEAMAAHDAGAARKLIAPGAPMLVVREDGSVHAGSDSGFVEAIGKDAAAWRERIWNAQVQVDGPMAQVWAPYDFHHDGKFSHCGVNSLSLVRGTDGWRIASVVYTMRKGHCPPGG